MNNNGILLVSAGGGPLECELWVMELARLIAADAACRGVKLAPLGALDAPSASSFAFAVEADAPEAFREAWSGTIRWVWPSSLRPGHRRKNWFAGVSFHAAPRFEEERPGAVRIETFRASGPGGQHVNRTESAVRATDLATGIAAVAADERSQHRNRELALLRLAAKLGKLTADREAAVRTSLHDQHRRLERGSPRRTFHGLPPREA